MDNAVNEKRPIGQRTKEMKTQRLYFLKKKIFDSTPQGFREISVPNGFHTTRLPMQLFHHIFLFNSIYFSFRTAGRNKEIQKAQVKGKVHPITGKEGQEVEKRYSSTLSLTSALDGGRWSTPRPGRFTPWKDSVINV